MTPVAVVPVISKSSPDTLATFSLNVSAKTNVSASVFSVAGVCRANEEALGAVGSAHIVNGPVAALALPAKSVTAPAFSVTPTCKGPGDPETIVTV